MTASASNPIGPTSRIFFSQRLRLHYVDWGNPEAPPLLLVHGGRDHCRNWDWVAQASAQGLARHLRRTCAGMATASGRRTATTRWRPTSTIWRSSSTSRALAPVTIVAHSLGGNICLRYAGVYPDKVRKLVAIEGLGPSPKVHRRAHKKPMERAHDRRGSTSSASCRPAAAAQVPDHRGCLQAHAGREQASLRRAGAPPDRAGRQPERGRHLQLEVRQLRPRLATLRHDAMPTSRSLWKPRSPVRPCWSTARRAGRRTRRRTAASRISRPRASCRSRAPATGAPRPPRRLHGGARPLPLRPPEIAADPQCHPEPFPHPERFRHPEHGEGSFGIARRPE